MFGCGDGAMGEGAWSAEIAEAADGPDTAVVVDCGLAVDRPDMGSDLDAGQRLRTGRLCGGIQPPPFAVAVAPFCCADEADTVELVDTCDDSDVEELDRGAVLRGMSILDTSSALMVVMPLEAPLAALHPLRRFG